MHHLRGRRHPVALLAVSAIVACALPAAASAHAYLVSSDPPAGARLATSPTQVVLRFNEDFVRGSAEVSLQRTEGTRVALAPPVERGATIVQRLPRNLRGIYLLTWSLVSDDGHPTQGSAPYSFGSSGALPAVTASSGPTQWPEAAADWFFFAGLALAFGGILSERLVWRRPPISAPVLLGIGVAVVATAFSLVLLAADGAHGDFASGLRGDALRDVVGSRPGALSVAMIVALLAAAVLVVARLRLVALVPLAATGVFLAYRGHAGTSGDWWAALADAVHVLAAAAWTGALAHLVLVLAAAPTMRSASAVPVRRYAELALPTVLVVLGTGVLTALAEFDSLSSLVDTGYGRTLLVKSALVVGALCFALASRLFALRSNPGVNVPLLRRLTAPELALVVAVLAAAGLLVNLAPPRSSVAATRLVPPPAPVVQSVPLRRSSIPTGPFVSAQEDDDLAVGFAASPAGAGRIGVTATVIDQNGNGANGLDLAVRVRSDRAAQSRAVTCGPGCYRAGVAVEGRPRAAVVAFRRPDGRSTSLRFAFPAQWPPRSATRIARRATRVFRDLRSVTIDERLSSGGAHTTRTTWRLEAPNRLSYLIRDGSRAVIIGDRRWDRDPGKQWVESPQTPLRQPTPTWGTAPGRATLIGSATVAGRPVWRVSFVDPSVPAWYTAAIDKRTYRTLALEMTAPAHFMRHVYSGFDEPVSIEPPRSP
ncbi:MAG TPA: copper resistance protein CopC [Gaiella sp.]|nr:copper resistance protein CopC [Gaiella sp.]